MSKIRSIDGNHKTVDQLITEIKDIRKQAVRLEKIVSSKNEAEEALKKSEGQLGASALIMKPVDLKETLEIIKRVLRKK